jgi:hypothetical protein
MLAWVNFPSAEKAQANTTMNTTLSQLRAQPQARLVPEQIARFRNEGYLIHEQPVLPLRSFLKLKDCFEGLLAALPKDERPEAMDVPHFVHPQLFEWAFDDAVLDLVAPIIGPDIALFSTHFICKPKGNGKRVPWHEDSSYWHGAMDPMDVCTVWLAIDPSTRENGCMMVIPRSHREGRAGYSGYETVDMETNVFDQEILPAHRDDARRVYIELQPNQCSLHDARIQHGSEPNLSKLRRCGWTLRYCPATVKFNEQHFAGLHQVYLARGRDRAGNTYADPARAYPELLERRLNSRRYRTSH